MAFPPQFLDELRARLSLADVVGRRVKLVKRGREHSGLCPFHNEKTPSFTVTEEKGFFHCFGCGAHGDVIGFVMRAEGLSFPEAVERLAGEAGLEVPKATPQERARAEKAKTLYEVLEAACVWFAGNLASQDGRAARDYLVGRGLHDGTIARFRLGFAPDRRDGIKIALMGQGFGEALLLEAGLIIRPEDNRPTYDRFRGRVIFPITDRRGRVVAFGGRLLAEREKAPKYLNSPDTPLFHKGRLLYALDKAWAAARDGKEIVVTEGYTDVIALHQAGFTGAVAPLGTALTETQIELLWRLVDEPILCFDGDAAGGRAAARAAERALPLLKPGKSLRFALLPAGEDPDSLIRALGPGAVQAVLDRAQALVDVVWRMVAGRQPADTPERRAGIRAALRSHAYAIADRAVQEYYLGEFEARLDSAFGSGRRQRGRRGVRDEGRPVHALGLQADGNLDILRLRQQQLLLATLLNHPDLMAEFGEALGMVRLDAPELDKLRQEILKSLGSGVDTADLQSHLIGQGFSGLLGKLLCGAVYEHGVFARPGGNLEKARRGWLELFERYHRRREFGAEIDAAVRALTDEPTSQNRVYLERVREQQLRTNDADWGDEDFDQATRARPPEG
ncbi:MAG: DNA primase [Alphaproteobacteria bacterium]|nr:DNA primase [Alphaproteobacteria bacterium]